MENELTVICSAWSGQKNFDELIAQHFEKTLAAGPGFSIVYAFDSGRSVNLDHPRFASVCSSVETTTAMSFNAALALVTTPYVCTLNLDDLYYPGVLDLLVDEMKAGDFAVGCADWSIDFDLWVKPDERKLLDAPVSINDFRISEFWPPERASKLRLGSGDGARGTMGPAPVYRTSTLRSVGGYAYTLSDGTPVRTVIDYIVWQEIHRAGGRFLRLPLLGGSYYSNPAEQQEFRCESKETSAIDIETTGYQKIGIAK